MKKILVVEDEKIIRKGIVSMINRFDINIEEILEAKNGEEALNILQEINIDLLITDIRMPKMDGITLIKNVQKLKYIPKIIVISGYDEFEYAIESLRNGVKEYLLKPLERNKLLESLNKIQNQILKEENKNNIEKEINIKRIKYIITSENVSIDEQNYIKEVFLNEKIEGEYILCCTPIINENIDFGFKFIKINKTYEGSIFILSYKDFNKMIEKADFMKFSVGFSKYTNDISKINSFFKQCTYARKVAFFKNQHINYSNIENMITNLSYDEIFTYFIQNFNIGKIDKGFEKIENIIFSEDIFDYEGIINLFRNILDSLINMYKNIIDIEQETILNLKNILSFENIEVYYPYFKTNILKIYDKIMEKFEDYKTKEKIEQAILYIENNYMKNLNMAMVSNHISMNYSLFSSTFKKYTGINFALYLQNIRIKKAKELLSEDYKIIEISKMVGYDNDKNFLKVFKKSCGISPTEYRKNLQIKNKLRRDEDEF